MNSFDVSSSPIVLRTAKGLWFAIKIAYNVAGETRKEEVEKFVV